MIHNNESLNTVVETFYVSETVNLIHDNEALDKWNEKVVELGLEGQTKVIVADKSPIPFMWMNQSIVATFEILCPTKVDITKYDKTPIPLELLEVVSLCEKEKYFSKIKVWYNEKEKDPAIVGYVDVPDGKYDGQDWYLESYGKKYLIGRWADVKASLDQLIDRARRLFFQAETIRVKKEIRDKQRELEDLESTVEGKFGGGMPSTNLPF